MKELLAKTLIRPAECLMVELVRTLARPPAKRLTSPLSRRLVLLKCIDEWGKPQGFHISRETGLIFFSLYSGSCLLFGAIKCVSLPCGLLFTLSEQVWSEARNIISNEKKPLVPLVVLLMREEKRSR